MGKRSDFERIPRDLYHTPREAVLPLIPYLPSEFTFCEPCAGAGVLIDHIEALTDGRCILACDIVPMRADIEQADALRLRADMGADLIITNSPWRRDLMHPMIEHFSDIAPTWMLFDADWMHTKQARAFRRRLRGIVSVGRVKWMPGTTMTGKDNAAWFGFTKPSDEPTKFFMGDG